MRVAFMVDQFPKLSETFILSQITTLIDRGHDVRIFALRPSGEPVTHDDVAKYRLLTRTAYAPELTDGYFGRVGSAVTLWRSTFGHPQGAPDRRALLRALDPRFGKDAIGLRLFHEAALFSGKFSFDVIHCHFGPLGILGARLKSLHGLDVPLFTTFYGFDMTRFVVEHGSGAYEELFEAGAEAISITHHWIARLKELGCPAERIHWVPLGLNVGDIPFSPRSIRADETRVLVVGRFVEKKGIAHAIGAIRRLQSRGSTIELRIVGEGPLHATLTERARALGVTESVRFLGRMTRTQVLEEMAGADIVMVPSVTASDGDQEGTPTVILEALAVGRPVIASRHSAIPEIVEHEKTGLLVTERDEQALAECVERILDDAGLAETLVKNGREYVEATHDSVRLARVHEQLYQGALSTIH